MIRKRRKEKAREESGEISFMKNHIRSLNFFKGVPVIIFSPILIKTGLQTNSTKLIPRIRLTLGCSILELRIQAQSTVKTRKTVNKF